MREPTPKPAGTWDFYGACAPYQRADGSFEPGYHSDTFTLGCFQWVPMSDPRHTKKGKVVKRFKGRSDDPKPAFDAARAWCAAQS